MAYYRPMMHLCRVNEQGWTETTKEPKRPMLVFKIQPLAEIIRGPDGEETFNDVPPSQYDATLRMVVDPKNEKSMDFALKKLRYAGFVGESFADLNLVGAEIRCMNEHSDYEGKTYDQWDFALPPLDQAPLNPLDNAAARKLDTLFGKRLKDKPHLAHVPEKTRQRTAASVAAQAPPEPQWEPEPPPDDEVPF